MKGYYVKYLAYLDDLHLTEILLLPVLVLNDDSIRQIRFKRGLPEEQLGLCGNKYYLQYPRPSFDVRKWRTETYIRSQIRETKGTIPPNVFRISVHGVNSEEDIRWIYNKNHRRVYQCTEVCGIEEDWGYETLILV